jgi:integrase
MDQSTLKEFQGVVGDLDLDEITEVHVESFLRHKRESGTQASSLNKIRDRLNWFFVRAQRARWGGNAAVMDIWPRLTVEGKSKTFVREELWPAWLSAAEAHSPSARAALALVLYGGLRVGEVQALKVKDIFLGIGEIRIYSPKEKTTHRRKMSRELWDEMERWLALYRKAKFYLNFDDWRAAFLIPSQVIAPATPGGWSYHHTRPYARLSRTLKAAREAAGIPGTGAAHVGRRSSGDAVWRRAREEGYSDPLELAATHLRHRDRRTTDEYLDQVTTRTAYNDFIGGSFHGETRPVLVPDGEMASVIPMLRGVTRDEPDDATASTNAGARGNVVGGGERGRAFRARRAAARRSRRRVG